MEAVFHCNLSTLHAVLINLCVPSILYINISISKYFSSFFIINRDVLMVYIYIYIHVNLVQLNLIDCKYT